MKYFLLFCLAYSITLYAQHPKKRVEAKKVIQKALTWSPKKV